MLAVLSKFRQSMMGLLHRKISRDRRLLLIKKRRNYVIYRCREAADRRARRLPRSLWIKPGRTDQWWQNMITGKLGPENWKENFRMDIYVVIVTKQCTTLAYHTYKHINHTLTHTTHTLTHSHTHKHTHTLTHTNTRARIQTHTHTHTEIHPRPHRNTHSQTRRHLHTHTHTPTLTHAHHNSYTHTHAHKLTLSHTHTQTHAHVHRKIHEQKHTNDITQHIHNSTMIRLARFQLGTRRAEVFTWENKQPGPPRSRSLNRDLGYPGWPVSIPFPARLSYKHFC